MQIALDTGNCEPEELETLLLQQKQLINGRRSVQMFPIGSAELPLPIGFRRHVNFRGIFHYDPIKITSNFIDHLSSIGAENLILNLGYYSKPDIAQRIRNGESATCITEYTKDGIEVRSAVGSTNTIKEQADYFAKTKEPDNVIQIGVPPQRLKKWLTAVAKDLFDNGKIHIESYGRPSRPSTRLSVKP